jgi:CRISPR/Cas system-associated exonuclease Cas4 (RecB family)
MAKLSQPVLVYDQTLADIDRALEYEQKLESPRNYLGASIIGDECWRKVFYDFKNCRIREIKCTGIKAIQDGFACELIMANRLKKLPYITLYTEDPQNPKQQIGIESLLGHLRGHLDGMIKGILEAPLTWHVWESKAVNEKKWDEFVKIRAEHGEKQALQLWDQCYYAQAQIYMHFTRTERHYITVMTPGGRGHVSARTEYNRKYAEMLIDKARQIIFDDENLPSRLSDNREFYKCKWCQFQTICHDGDFSDINCKTCRYRKCVENGANKCLLTETIIEPTKIGLACKNHIYNPALVQAKFIEHQLDSCLYERNGIYFANTSELGFPREHALTKGKEIEIFTSKELKERLLSTANIGADVIKTVRAFDGEVTDPDKTKKWKELKSIDSRLEDI